MQEESNFAATAQRKLASCRAFARQPIQRLSRVCKVWRLRLVPSFLCFKYVSSIFNSFCFFGLHIKRLSEAIPPDVQKYEMKVN